MMNVFPCLDHPRFIEVLFTEETSGGPPAVPKRLRLYLRTVLQLHGPEVAEADGVPSFGAAK